MSLNKIRILVPYADTILVVNDIDEEGEGYYILPEISSKSKLLFILRRKCIKYCKEKLGIKIKVSKLLRHENNEYFFKAQLKSGEIIDEGEALWLHRNDIMLNRYFQKNIIQLINEVNGISKIPMNLSAYHYRK